MSAAENRKVTLVIGDSVVLALDLYLDRARWLPADDFVVDGAVCRRLTAPGCLHHGQRPAALVSVLDSLMNRRVGGVVLVGGYIDQRITDEVPAVMAAARAGGASHPRGGRWLHR